MFLFVLAALAVSSVFTDAFILESPPDVILPTYISNLQYESIQFQKRAKNDSVHLVLEFKVVNLTSKNVEVSLTFNNQSVAVGNPGDRGGIYVSKEFDSAGVLTYLSLNIRDGAANAGVYVLKVSAGSESASAEAQVLSPPILPVFSKPKRVLQGDPLRISCRVSAYPTPKSVQWLFAPILVELSDDKAAISDASANLKPIDFSVEGWKDAKFSTEDGTLNDTLRFDSITVAQNGLFACNVSNELGTDSTFLLVGVKDRWAALWPFIGIVVEVTVLVAAILLYERHQIRKRPSAPVEPVNNPDAASPNGNAVDKNSKPDEVRLRNARA